jgi:hypothetical protein
MLSLTARFSAVASAALENSRFNPEISQRDNISNGCRRRSADF